MTLLSDAVMVALPSELTVPAVAVKVAEVEFAAMETDAGTVTAALLDDRDAVITALSEALDSVTVQVLAPLDAKVVGEHCTEERLTGACREMVAVEVAPLSDAVTVALPSELTVPAVAVKVAEVEVAGRETVVGTVSAALLDDRDTAVAVVSDAFDRVMVQVLVALEARLEGLQVSDDRLTGACSESVLVADVPLSEAVTVALPFDVNEPAVAVKVALLDPEATVTEAGTVSAELLEDSATLAPVVPLRLTVHVLEPPDPTGFGVHVKLLTVNDPTDPATMIDPPDSLVETASPAGDAPN